MPDVRTQSPRSAHPYAHDDAPDTDAAFRRIVALPDGPQKTALRQEVVRAWAPMAVRLARRFRHHGESFEDLTQVAQLGLVKAVTRFDPSLGTAFPSFAIPTILGEVKRHFRDHLWDVHVPRRVQELRGRVRSAGNELASFHGHEPSVHAIAAHAGLTEAEVRLGQEALESFTALSLDAVPGPSGHSHPLTDTLGGPEPRFDVIVDREALRPLLRALPERERKILYMRFFGEMTQNRIALQLGLSQMHVSRLITRTCARLRDQVMAEPHG
ncbi:SigB/SigF/SigG family RNA polymerase sigma factor [Streptomyces sp. NBC_00201]|uniref:SigB/SigF/SigG family RNA polymerase sigma factor n=1 Tax=unclassified Streptomyces TaxID=2593676 RepID=UPI002257998E|nr:MULTISPECIES: SigB/SigF/SigG family RNA polymerase sigma factor [unclassified Streptomyces]MCX5050003.1 SigB/SigF/SigG family RNA polymerase sigma factor [Streptomyces sp. NBC_00474]MCX5247935.1 SigB/SigF/SigG family RNA polymerase sigma factor [Streptomyces sp. NBC_00201]MCX5286306.1 SigB/SigF/SigG family RNA polymerase sigma factor [Streptomyces sp. NBC_00183]